MKYWCRCSCLHETKTYFSPVVAFQSFIDHLRVSVCNSDDWKDHQLIGFTEDGTEDD